jgi:hypothetical protein
MLSGSTTTTTTTTTGTGTISGIPAGFQFTTNLKQGSTGNDVKYLQILLNSDPVTSLQNAGRETTYFGAMTKAAVIKFQAKYASEVLAPYGLTAGTGFFGTSSRAKANAILSSSTGYTLPAGCTSSSGFSPTTGQSCSGTGVTLPAGCTSTSGYSPTTGQSCSGTSQLPTGTDFSIRLSTDNPASGTFVQGQATADLAHFTFSNGTGTAINITGVELTRLGISADATLANVYLFDGSNRLTDAASVSSGKVTFNSTSGIFTIPANSVKVVAVKSDLITPSNGQTIGVSLSGVTSNATLANTVLPISGNIHNIASATLAGVTITNVLPGPGATTTDPVTGVRVWETTFTVTNRNVQFTKLALKQINSIDKADLSNFKLLVDGVEVATVASLDSNNYITFTFDKTLVTGSRNIKVLADVNGGSSRYIQFSLRNKADVDVRDSEYNVNVAIAGAPATTGTIQVNEGVFTITNKNAALPITVASSASNALIGKWEFKATGEAVKVETLTAGFNYTNAFVATTTNPANGSAEDLASQATCNGTYTHSVNGVSNSSCAAQAATLRNAKIMINGAQAGSTATLVAAGTPFTVNYTFQPGVVTAVELYADIYDNDALGAAGIVAGDTIAAKLIQGAANGTKQISLGTLAVPTAGQATNSLLSVITVAQGAATVVATPNYGSPQNTVLPRSAFKIGSWTATGSTAEDINVNSLSFAIAPVTNTTFTVADMYDMYVVYKIGSGTEITTSTRPTPTTPADFSVSFTLPRTQTVTIDLYASLSDNGLDQALGAAVIAPLDSVQATLTVAGTGSQSGAAAAFGAPKAGQVIVYRSAGLTVTKDASSPVASLVSANNTVKTVSYKFDASNDNYDVVKLVFSIVGGDASAVSMVNLKEGSTILQSQPAAATVTFTGFSPAITITSGTPKVLDVELVLGNVGVGAGNTGSALTTDLTGASSLVRPSSTGQVGAISPDAANGNVMYVYKATPVITLTTLPTTLLTQGTNTLSKFTIGTNGTGTIGWKKLTFKVTKTDGSGGANVGAISTPTLWDAGTNTEIPGAIDMTAALGSTDNQTGYISFVPTNEEQISGSKTYALKATVGAVIAVGDSIITMIENASTSFAGSAGLVSQNIASTLKYVDTNLDGVVSSTTDVRKSTTVSTGSAYAQTNTGVVTFDATATDNGDEVLSYGDYTNNATIVLTETGAATNTIGADTGTLNSVDGYTCTAYDAANGTGSATVLVASIQSIKCVKAGVGQIVLNVDPVAPNAAAAVTTITLTKGSYAIDSAVGANDSDVGLSLSGIFSAASFVWSDVSAQNHSILTSDWTGDYLVRQLPTDTQNLTK